MRNVTLQVVRGLKANIPTLASGELYFCTDTRELFVGSSGGNVHVGLEVFSAAGVLRAVPCHIVDDTATIGSAGTVTVSLTGGAAYSSATSYICVASDISAKNRSPMINQVSGSQIIFTGNAGDVIHFYCIGN